MIIRIEVEAANPKIMNQGFTRSVHEEPGEPPSQEVKDRLMLGVAAELLQLAQILQSLHTPARTTRRAQTPQAERKA